MNAETPEYTQHDYSAVNSYVGAIQEKHSLENARRRAGVFSTYALYGSGVVLAVGIAAFLIMWGYSLLSEKPEPKVIETEKIIERPVPFSPTIIVDGGSGGSQPQTEIVKRAAEKAGNMNQASTATSSASDSRPVFNFSIFKSVPFDPGGLEHVVVGMRYPDNNADYPEYQWCYVERVWENGVAEVLDLAVKNSVDGQVIEIPLTSAKANQLATTVETLKQAREICVFQ